MRFTRLPHFPAAIRPGRPAAFPARVRRAAAFLLALPALLAAGLPAAAQAGEYAPPADYYAPAGGLAGEGLKAALNQRIRGHSVLSYQNDVPGAISVLDEDPDQPGNVILLYSGYSVSGAINFSVWNREHTWPRSYGAGTGPAYSDLHHLFPANPGTNSDRLNYPFNWAPNGRPVVNAPESLLDTLARPAVFEPRDADKGRLARVMFYMDTRYEGSDSTGVLRLADTAVGSGGGSMAYLGAFLEWNRMYPPDTREERRNHLIHSGFVLPPNRILIQGNRNPFVDYPDFADAIYTSTLYQTWGSWRVNHFSLEQMDDPSVSSFWADPSASGLPNVFLFSQNLDPLDPGDDFPRVTRTAGGRVGNFHFRRLKDAAKAGVIYQPEYSETPLTEDSWSAWPVALQSPTTSTDGLTQTVRLADFLLPPPERARHFRLRIQHVYPVADPQEFVFDPVSTLTDSDSIFRYFEHGQDGFREVDWFGAVMDTFYPWVEHRQHGLVHVDADDEESVWLYDPEAGWLHTGRTLHPWFYSPADGAWYWFVDASVPPERWFYDPGAGQFFRISTQ